MHSVSFIKSAPSLNPPVLLALPLSSVSPLMRPFAPLPEAPMNLTCYLREIRNKGGVSVTQHDFITAIEYLTLSNLETLSAELCRLDDMSSEKFWEQVACSSRLPELLDNFLRFRCKVFDYDGEVPRRDGEGVPSEASDLHLEVLLFYHRISSNKDSGMTMEEHAVLLKEKKFLDLPKLMEICVLFKDYRDSLAKELVTNAIKSMPSLITDISFAVDYFIKTFDIYYHRCMKLFELLAIYPDFADSIRHQLFKEWFHINMFFFDAIATMECFVDAYNPAAIFLSCPSATSITYKDILMILGKFHDTLIPSYQQEFGIIFPSAIILNWKIRSLGWKLLKISYLSDNNFGEMPDIHKISRRFPGTEDDPIIRGHILYKTMKRLSNGMAPCANQIGDDDNILQSMERSHHLSSEIKKLCEKGWITFNDDQWRNFFKMVALPASNVDACYRLRKWNGWKELESSD